MADAKATVDVDGHRLALTNLDKVMYPVTGTTKGDVIAYYAEIAPLLIAHAHDRPATRKRWVDGVGTARKPAQVFFQKNLEVHAPSWVKRHSLPHSKGDNVYPLVNDAATLVWLAQLAALEIHVPQWRFGPRGARRNPDRLVLDLDPGEGAGLQECVAVAKYARTMLKHLGLDPVPVTSGSKGIHLYAELDGSSTSDAVSALAHEVARALESEHPDLVVSDMKKTLRGGKVLVDWSQNNAAKTTVAPYSLRGREHPTVAVPRTWREISAADLQQLTYDEVLIRMRKRADPMAELADVETSETSASGPDKLTVYRQKRDSARTPEPVPADTPSRFGGDSFVIQEHHASRLHWDFRLERDGVLVSWALPKGVPTDPKQNHLAVQTEDHPLEYATFAGAIPKGEYGGGHVTIWDHGTYELEKWRDGKEVIVTLHGAKDGGLGRLTRVALIHTGRGNQANQWLIHLMEPAGRVATTIPVQPMLAKPGAPTDIRGADWALEMKWDGIRVIADVAGGAARLWTRNGNDVTPTFPELAVALADAVIVDDAVIDGEIVALDPSGRPSFEQLQQRLGLTAPKDVTAAAARVPAFVMAFDVLRCDGRPTVGLPYRDRRVLLGDVLRENAAVHVPPAFEGNLDAAMRASRASGLEGVVAKRTDSPYRPAKRTADWIKLKHDRMQEVIVGGWWPGQGNRAGTVGSLLVAVPDADGVLQYAGRVGTGFTSADLDAAHAAFEKAARKTSPMEGVPASIARHAHWVSPLRVGEVRFTEWTSAGQLRHPVWRGWRPDKSPDQVVRE